METVALSEAAQWDKSLSYHFCNKLFLFATRMSRMLAWVNTCVSF